MQIVCCENLTFYFYWTGPILIIVTIFYAKELNDALQLSHAFSCNYVGVANYLFVAIFNLLLL